MVGQPGYGVPFPGGGHSPAPPQQAQYMAQPHGGASPYATSQHAIPGQYGVQMPMGNPVYQPQPGAQPPYGYAAPQPIPTQSSGPAYAPVRMPDGSTSYAPVVAQMVNGQLQYVTTGSPTNSPPGMQVLQPSPTGYPGQQQASPSFGEMYRQAVDKDQMSTKSVKEWNKKHEKEMAKLEKMNSKKLREWESQQRAREDAEEKALRSARDKDTTRTRKISGYVERDRKISGNVSDMDARFANMGVGGATAGGYYGTTGSTRHRRQSVSIDDTGGTGTRSRRASTSYPQNYYPQGAQTPGAFGRSQPPSPIYPTSTFEGMPGGIPIAGGQYPPPPGRYGAQAQSPYTPQPGLAAPYGNAADPSRRALVPASFYREPTRQPYTPFPKFDIVWDINLLGRETHPLPAALLPCDVTHEDWKRCMDDLVSAWNGVVPYELFRAKPRNLPISPGSALAAIIDIWNTCFFLDRNVELILYRGLERRTGPTAGRRDERLNSKQVPSNYLAAARRRKRHARDEDDSSSSSSSGSSSLDDVDDNDYDSDAPVFANQGGNAPQPFFPTTPGNRSRRNSTAVRPEMIPLDAHEKWAVRSRESALLFKKARKDAKRERKARRKQKRLARGEKVQYSLWISYIRRRT